MSAFKQSMRKLAVRAGLLAGASAAILAIAGVNAGGAMATGPPSCPNSQSVEGRGSSLQKIAQQEVWTVKYNAACSNKPKVTYTSTSSGSGLETFGFTGSSPAVNTAFGFIGTDDGPNATQIASAETASKTKPIIIPVTQTAISVVIHPPAGCEFEEETGITWTELNKVFGGNTITNWNQFEFIEEAAPGDCNQAITRVVRKEGSGTTYQFKNYLSVLETTKGAEAVPCSVDGTTEWGKLLEVGTGEKPNIDWPKCTGSSSPIVTAAGGGAVAEEVAKVANVGYIGYASLPDAKAKGAKVADLQNGVSSGEPSFAEPGKETSKGSGKGTARCENARYTVPEEGIEGFGTGVAVNWSRVFGAQPNIGGTEYPLCTLTYDVAWLDYSLVGYTEAAAQQAAVKDYLENYVTTGGANGQSDLASAGKWYSALPTGAGSSTPTDVQEAAEFAAMRIGTGTEGLPALPLDIKTVIPKGGEETLTLENVSNQNVQEIGLDLLEVKNAGVTAAPESTCLTEKLVLKPKGTCTLRIHSTSATLTASGTVHLTYFTPGPPKIKWGLSITLE